jgi:hypothetical protein
VLATSVTARSTITWASRLADWSGRIATRSMTSPDKAPAATAHSMANGIGIPPSVPSFHAT